LLKRNRYLPELPQIWGFLQCLLKTIYDHPFFEELIQSLYLICLVNPTVKYSSKTSQIALPAQESLQDDQPGKDETEIRHRSINAADSDEKKYAL